MTMEEVTVLLVTDPSRWWMIRCAICQKNDNVRYVAAVTCRWRQHHCTNMGKCSGRVDALSRVTKCRDSWLDCSDRRVRAQIKPGSNNCRVGDETHACVTAVYIEKSGKLRQKRLRKVEVVCSNATGVVQHNDNIYWTLRWNSCNREYELAFYFAIRLHWQRSSRYFNTSQLTAWLVLDDNAVIVAYMHFCGG